ncbi:MAG: hypothetical protein R6X06_03090 [Gammaproteobacteria bacterium]
MISPIEQYSLRRLSPFRGTTRILQQLPLRAISNDGLTWRLQLQCAAGNNGMSARPVLFGLWQRTTGLKTFPVHAQQASPALLQRAHVFAARLPDRLAQGHFPLRDNVECWLLDQAQQPLALLQACQEGEPLPSLHQDLWRPCAADDHTFVASQSQQVVAMHPDADAPLLSHRDVLARQVNGAAGPVPSTQWFRRQDDGGGIALTAATGTPAPEGRHLPAAAFPHYLLKQDWPTADEQQLANDFFHWQAPWLLTLPDLSDAERRQLETDACADPRRLQALYHLYPILLQKTLIQDTLIRARLERASPRMTE